MPTNFPVVDTTSGTKLDALAAKLPASLGSKTGAASVSVVLASDQVVPLPTGAATGAKQDTANTSLAAIAGSVDGLEASAASIDNKLTDLAVKEKLGNTPTENVVAIDTTIDLLLAADANRRRFVVLNPHASAKLGLTTNPAGIFANCAIRLGPGDMWVEALIPHMAWYAIYDTGGSASVPVQSAN